MEKLEIGRFYAKSFKGSIFEFIVYNDDTMDCPTLGINSISRIIIKPRFVLFGEELYYIYNELDNPNALSKKDLIIKYEIKDDLFNYLKSIGMIKYSNDMAYLYGFKDTDGYDKNNYGVGSPFKWAKKKGPILMKQKRGEFN